MEPELAAQLGLQPPDGSSQPRAAAPGEGAPSVPQVDTTPTLEEQRRAREGDSSVSSGPPPGPAAPDLAQRVSALEAENAQLKAGQQPDARVQATEFLTAKTAEINQLAQLALSQMMAGEVAAGQMTPEQAQQQVRMAQTAALAQVQKTATEISLAPALHEYQAGQIAKEFSLPNVSIEPKDLLGETTEAGMRGRAKALQELRRDQSFTKRVREGTDAAESAGGQTTVDPRLLGSMSGASLIRLGIQRGHTG